MDESLEVCGAGHSCTEEGPVEENQDWLPTDVEVQRWDSDWPDNEHGPAK